MLKRILRRLQRGIGRSRPAGKGKKKPYELIVAAAVAHRSSAVKREGRDGKTPYKEYVVRLPDGYGPREIVMRLSVPELPGRFGYEFTEHVPDSGIVIAGTTGGFVVSHDLAATWREIKVTPYRGRRFVHVKTLSDGEYLVQTEPLRRNKASSIDLLVVSESGDILAATPSMGVPWHGCRAVDVAGGTIMYAEYPPNPGHDNRLPARVFRSRDRGRTWQVVFEKTGAEIRHFHFLQARPGATGEWWLTSGDAPAESRIWITRNDGDEWTDITSSEAKRIAVGGAKYARDLFRLTDLVWQGDEVIWGTDDLQWDVKGGDPGAQLFRSAIGPLLAPEFVARGKWHFRSLVDTGDFHVAISQGCPEPRNLTAADASPSVYLVPKSPRAGLPTMVHLFDIDTYSRNRTGFTYARASRAATDGTFFSYRVSSDVFPRGHACLKWQVTFS